MTEPGHSYSRRVLTTAGIYIAAAWAVVEALLTVVDRFGLPSWWGPLITALFVSGLPVTVYMVWRTAGPERKASPGSILGSALFLVVATAGLFWATRPPPVPSASVVAVLPCEFEGDSKFAYRAEGLPEDIHARLSRVGAVKISSWNSSLFVRDKGFPPSRIAEVLHVDRLVQCHLKSDSDRIELVATVTDPTDDSVVWKNRYDFSSADLGTVMTQLAGTLLDVLGTPAEASELDRLNHLGTFSPEAYDLYLQARYLWSRQYAEGNLDSLDPVEELLTHALAIDPDYAEALVQKAEVYLRRANAQEFGNLNELHARMVESRDLAQHALELDSGVLQARMILLTACGELGQYYNEPCLTGKEDQLTREECEIRGDTAEGWACWRRLLNRRGEDSSQALARWLVLEPTSIEANINHMFELWRNQGRKSEALSVFDTLRALEPNDPRPLGAISNLLRGEGRLDEVLAWRRGVWGDSLPENPWLLARLGTDYLDLGLYDQAMDIGVRTWHARRASATHFLPQIWIHDGQPGRAAEAIEWLVATLQEATGLDEPKLQLASFYAMDLHDSERAKAEYESTLGDKALKDVCRDPDCVLNNALVLAHIEKSLGHKTGAASWLTTAQQVSDAEPDEVAQVFLLILQDRHAEAVDLLRENVFSWVDTHDGLPSLMFPLLFLQQSAMFDPLREEPAFKQLVNDYDAYLQPLQQHVLEAERTGDWEALRRQTYRRINS